MLNLFPIQFLALLAYFLLRVITGLALMVLGFSHLRCRHELAPVLRLRIFPFGRINLWLLVLFELFVSTLLVLGLFTQGAALLLIAYSTKMSIFNKSFAHRTIPGRLTYCLFLGIGLSLLITGAGAFAFDLPI